MIGKPQLNQFKKMINVFEGIMSDLTVTLVEDQTQQVVRGHIGIRAAGSPLTNSAAYELTGGSDQDKMVCVVLPDSWDKVIARPPKKGDILEKEGMRYSVQRAIAASPGDILMMYKMEVRG